MARRELLTFDRKAHDAWGDKNNITPYALVYYSIIECEYCEENMFKAHRERDHYTSVYLSRGSGFLRLKMNNTFICEECMGNDE